MLYHTLSSSCIFRFVKQNKEDYEFLWNLHKATMKSYVEETWGWNEQFQKEYFNNQFETNSVNRS